MAPTTAIYGKSLSPHELFHYSTAHQVLICTSCHYAVQPTAIARHLKDIHHFTREERRPFEAYRNTLHLRDPVEVEYPSPEEFPVACLPVEQGWQCESPGCQYLCVSVKRMQNHWPAEHGCKGDASCDWRSVPLQTFFRGNMTKYFTQDSRFNQVQQEKVFGQARSKPKALYTGDSAFNTRHMRKIKETYKLDSMDSFILENYPRLAYTTFVSDDHNERLWLDVIPGLVYGNEFLLHGLLACTAQCMMHVHPADARQEIVLRACSHQDRALPAFRNAVNSPTENNCDAIMAFSYFLVVYTLATDIDDQNNPSLLFVENAP